MTGWPAAINESNIHRPQPDVPGEQDFPAVSEVWPQDPVRRPEGHQHYKGFLDNSTKYSPTWVKVAVALALGLGTMIGWKRIVVTVGEKIGKTHMTYAHRVPAPR